VKNMRSSLCTRIALMRGAATFQHTEMAYHTNRLIIEPLYHLQGCVFSASRFIYSVNYMTLS
jgi:hypothetical protein